MSDSFDPYYRWLGIPPQEQPPNHYRLLGINLFEEDEQVIEAAADRQMGYLRTFQSGQHVRHSQKLLNELAQARVCLLNRVKKNEYDDNLRSEQGTYAPAEPQVLPGANQAIRPTVERRDLSGLEQAVANLQQFPAVSTAVIPVNWTPMRPARRDWRQPALLAAGIGSVLVIGVVAIWLSHGSSPAPGNGQQPVAQKPIAAMNPPARGEITGAPKPGSEPPKPPKESTSRTVTPAGSETERVTADSAPSPADAPTRPAGDAASPVKTPAANPMGAEGQRIDLLQQIDVSRDRVRGDWRFEDAKLIGVPSDMAVLQIPYRPDKGEYRLEIIAEVIDQTGPLNVCVICPQAKFLVCIGLGQNTLLSFVDGQHFHKDATWRTGEVFALNVPTKIQIDVRKEGVEASADGRRLFQWQEYDRLAPNTGWMGKDKESLAMGWNFGSFRIHKLEVTRLDGQF